MIKALIFDMDGTIVDNMAVHTAVWLEILAGLGVTISGPQFQAAVAGKTNLETLRQLLNPSITEAEALEISYHKEVRYREQYRPIMQPMPGLLPLLQAARQANVPLAVATAAGQENIDFVMNGLQMWDSFDAIVGADDVARGKPHPDLFLLAAERLGVPPEQCLVFEDAIAGIEAGRRANMPVIAVASAHTPNELADLPGVRQVIKDFNQLQLSDLID
ncbi:MAG: beta-phosphoglucomutase [Ardenticatenaceae bacterium]|nr:MAG: beta-phosphoglucomutase [Ardenticatenaceae bacterium]